MAVLPPAATEEAFAAIRQEEAVLRPGIDRLCLRLGVDTSALVRCAAGSRPVYEAGELILKLFPPVTTWPGYQVEAEVLAAAEGRLPTPTPRVRAAGEFSGWGYVLMSRLPGVPLDTIWERVSAADRDRLAQQLGETLAALHQLPPPVITSPPSSVRTPRGGLRAGSSSSARTASQVSRGRIGVQSPRPQSRPGRCGCPPARDCT